MLSREQTVDVIDREVDDNFEELVQAMVCLPRFGVGGRFIMRLAERFNEGRLLKYARSKGDPRMVVLGSLQFRPAQFDALCLSRKACALVVTTGPLGSAYREIVQKLVKMHRTVRRFQSFL